MNITDLVAALDELKDQSYKELLSGTARHRKVARDSIAKLQPAFEDFTALTILDDVKKWISNDPSAKALTFLENINSEANKLATTDRWLQRWLAGRGHRYAGRYRRAYKRYNRAIEMIEDLIKKGKDPGDIKYDVYADFAEFLVYMGAPSAAIDYLAKKVPEPKELGWHAWVRAFAIHQNAFATDYPIGAAAEDKPGQKAGYDASNQLIDTILDPAKYGRDPLKLKLSESERCDLHLLKAANFGAMIRIDPKDASAIAGAAAALTVFSGGKDADPMNVDWSWQKERRGRFMKVHRPKSDDGLFGEKLSKAEVEAWRELYEGHFKENLRHAGVPLTASKTTGDERDGEVDLVEDHPDDDKN